MWILTLQLTSELTEQRKYIFATLLNHTTSHFNYEYNLTPFALQFAWVYVITFIQQLNQQLKSLQKTTRRGFKHTEKVELNNKQTNNS